MVRKALDDRGQLCKGESTVASVPGAAERIGAPFDGKRGIVQPAERILGKDRKVLHATDSMGPSGRIPAADAQQLLRYLKSRK